jgi:hypothetical protein
MRAIVAHTQHANSIAFDRVALLLLALLLLGVYPLGEFDVYHVGFLSIHTPTHRERAPSIPSHTHLWLPVAL